MNLIDTLFPQVNTAAVSATNTARPFTVTISIDSATQTWLSVVIGIVVIVFVVKK